MKPNQGSHFLPMLSKQLGRKVGASKDLLCLTLMPIVPFHALCTYLATSLNNELLFITCVHHHIGHVDMAQL